MTKVKGKQPVAKCDNHKIPEGKVYRTIREEMGISRERVCPLCGEHYWTAELTKDVIAEIKRELEEKLYKANSDRIAYKQIVETASNAIWKYEEVIKNLKEAAD